MSQLDSAPAWSSDRARRLALGRSLVPSLVVLFFFSGASGLVYQVLWQRLLSLVFGVTVFATSTVLASSDKSAV